MQYAALFFISALWGGSFVLIKVLSVDLSSFSIAVERTLIAAAALSALAFTRKRTVQYGGWAWRRLACLALVGQVVPFILLSVAGHLTTSINLAFMMGSAPLVTFAMSAIFPPREHWNALTVLGLLLGGIGVGASLYSPSIPTISSYHALTHGTLGQMAALGAAASFAAGAIISRNLSSRMDSFLVVTHSMCISASVLAVSALFGKLIFSTNISLPSGGREIACLVSLGFFNTALAYVVYFRLIHVAGATFAALNNYLVPPLGLFFGWFLLGEDVKSTIWIGLILIISGVILVRKSQARA